MEWVKQKWGWEARTKRALFVFGNGQLTQDRLPSIYPHFEFSHLHQVHGGSVIEAPGHGREADGQWTRTPGLALAIKTADCLPVLLYSEGTAIALHAGWRGLEQNIIGTSKDHFQAHHPESLACIGPGIGPASFEIGLEVYQRLEVQGQVARKKFPEYLFHQKHPDPSKVYYDTRLLTEAQIQLLGLDLNRIHHLEMDTYSDQRFHSFRRDSKQAGRQMSFVVLLN